MVRRAVRGRIGWLATPNLLLFGTGGFAQAGTRLLSFRLLGFGAICTSGVICFAGSSSEIRTGWTAGGGVEWLLDQHWSAKIEYQFVDLGTETVRITALVPFAETTPASFNAAFHDRFNVVRLGLNYRF